MFYGIVHSTRCRNCKSMGDKFRSLSIKITALVVGQVKTSSNTRNGVFLIDADGVSGSSSRSTIL